MLEPTSTIASIAANPVLAGAFSSRQIEQTADQMLQRAKTGVGRNGLFRELDDVKAKDHDGTMREDTS